MVYTTEIILQSKGHTDIHDITDQVARAVGDSGLKDGLATIFTPSSTSALTTVEYEPGAVADLKRALENEDDTHKE